jgi:uncharacterized repeat protein (TIGR01451 family)
VVVTATGTLAPYALGQVYNTATVGLPSGIVDPVLSNNSATDVDTVTPAADMSVTQDDDPDPLFMGQALAYTMTVRNSGPATATAVTLTATLPPGAPFVSSTPGPPTCTQATGVLTCDLGPIDVLASSEVTAVVQAAAPGPLSNVAVVSAAELDLFPVNNTWTETSLVVDRRPREIGHRSGQVEDLSPATSPIPGADLFRMLQRARSSYEVVVDAVTGDLGPSGPGLDRVQEDGSTVVQSSTAAGAGGSRVLAWQTASPGPVDEEYIRVTSNGCSPCEAEDTYRIRAWETTAVVPRFNNSGTQVTLLLIQNTTDRLVTGTVWLQAPDGSVAATLSLSLPARQILVVNTASVSPSGSGSIRISHDGGLGALQGKAVAVEPATGFTFDTRLQYRP